MALAIAACSGSGPSATSNNSAADTGPATLSLSLMDAPVDDVAAVNLVITRITIKPEEGPEEELPLSESPIEANLLTLTNDDPAALVQNAVIEPGTYEWIRMYVDAEIDSMTDDSNVETNTGEIQELFVPSGRVQLIGELEIGEAEQVELLFDWDVRSGLVHPPGRGAYHLKPVIRVTDILLSSTLRGTIDMSLVVDGLDPETEQTACNADNELEDYDIGNTVYIFEGHDVTPDDIDEEMDVTPLATVDATPNAEGDYEYSTALGTGTYTVAFTCQAGNDMPETNETGNALPEDDTVTFLADTYNVTVEGDGAEIVVDFEAPAP
jgi:hypothetical protein